MVTGLYQHEQQRDLLLEEGVYPLHNNDPAADDNDQVQHCDWEYIKAEIR
jgi:hypothetical protein